jgi:hypothetical protein
MLTQGSPLSPSAFFSQIHPSRGSYTSVAPAENGVSPLFGQVNYQLGERSARVAYITPENSSILSGLPLLLDDLARQSGEWGAYHLLAEIDETSPAFEAFRRAGFSVFAWQRIWKLPPEMSTNLADPDWTPADLVQENNIRSLFLALVPPLVLAAEPTSVHTFQGLVCTQNGEAAAYADIDFGPRGIYIKPLFHPDAVDVDCLIRALISALPNQSGRPVYLAVRSYQSWLENALSDLGAETAPRQAVLVKHLIARQRTPVRERSLKALEQRRVEPSAPMARVEPFKSFFPKS